MSPNWKLFWFDVCLAALTGAGMGIVATLAVGDPLTLGKLWPWAAGLAAMSALAQSFFRFKQRGPDA